MFFWFSKLIFWYWIIIFVLLLHGAYSQYRDNANLLCTQLMSTQLLEKCCGDSKPSNLPFEQSDCKQYTEDYGPCRYECIFKHWKLLHTNNTLIMSNVTAMINKLYPYDSGYYRYSVMLIDSFEHCESLSNTYTGMMHMYASLSDQEPGMNSVGLKCSKNAMIFAKCVIANMFLNCPLQNWQENLDDCIASRRLLTHCVQFLSGIDDANTFASFRSPSLATSHRLLNRGLKHATHWYTAFINWLVF